MLTLKVDLPENSYPIYIGENLLNNRALLHKYIRAKQILIVSTQKIADLYLDKLRSAFADFQCDFVLLPDGEENKTLATVSVIFDALIAGRHHRTTTLIALGGGVIGDMTGFAAACYQRGVNFIQVPTTLLAQVDASVGGKTGVNHPKAKNMIGAFHQPRCVVIDINTLSTLPHREFCSGFAEIIKAALIKDAGFFSWIEKNIEKLLARDAESLSYAIEQACAVKIKVVMADEKDIGQRSLLNYGHTFGHAIERTFNYRNILHGEAVAIGMVMAAQLSEHIGWLEAKSVQQIKNILTRAGLPIRMPNSLACTTLLDCMQLDKKTDDTGLKLILLKSIGHAILVADVDPVQIEQVLRSHCGT